MEAEGPTYERPHVLLMVETSIAYGRGILKGITRWLRTHRRWSMYLEQHELSASPPAWLADWHGDGVICRVTDSQVAAILGRSGIPVIDLNDLYDELGFVHIRSDHRAIGHMAAEHLIDRGFRRLGFCGFSDQRWSGLRLEGARDRAAASGLAVEAFESDWFGPRAPEWERGQEQLKAWLQTFPRPFAVIACNDLRGQQVLDAARRAGLAVPEEAGVIGVDDDALLCDLCDPPLSSVRCNPEEIGYRAAEQLDSLMAVHRVTAALRPTQVLVPPLGVTTRQSTDILAIADPTLAAVLRMIRERACDGLTIRELVRHSGLSRTKLERLFRETLGRTLQQEIRGMQIKRARELLAETDLPLEKIAPLVGFSQASYLSHAFKREVGESPRDYRRRAQAGKEGGGADRRSAPPPQTA
ncbi:MAG: DNA-binding transcriptional regulator [Planctomycetia bacterium]|nr:DNA-binding transcriptional regulator [Planctomycetia bacterium]